MNIHPEVIQDASVHSILAEKEMEQVLKKAGDLCTYEQLSAAMGMNPQQRGYPYVMTARKRFENKHGCVLDTVPKVGIKWLTPDEVVMIRGTRDVNHMRRHTRLSLRRQKTTFCVEAEESLGRDGITKRNENISYLGTLHEFMKPKYARKISTATAHAERILTAKDTLEFFKQED